MQEANVSTCHSLGTPASPQKCSVRMNFKVNRDAHLQTCIALLDNFHIIKMHGSK